MGYELERFGRNLWICGHLARKRRAVCQISPDKIADDRLVNVIRWFTYCDHEGGRLWKMTEPHRDVRRGEEARQWYIDFARLPAVDVVYFDMTRLFTGFPLSDYCALRAWSKWRKER
jgi:hypothetical protein